MKKNELVYLQNDLNRIISVFFFFFFFFFFVFFLFFFILLCIEYNPINQLIPISVL